MKKWFIDSWNKPSQKTLEAAFPGKGKELRDLITWKRDPERFYRSVDDLVMRAYRHPHYDHILITGKRDPERFYRSVDNLVMRAYHHQYYDHILMIAINEVLEGHGIEVVRPRDDKHPSYDYINMGDSYATTILLRNDGKLIVSSWGHIVEKHMDWYE